MSKEKSSTNIWLIIGVVVLIALLLIWLTVADFFGDTDVAAMVSPLV
jgi:ABC-type cobalt transport system substrate-binding protein